MEWRENYVNSLRNAENGYIEHMAELQMLLWLYPGIILTTRQDKGIELLMENQYSMPAADLVFTPDQIANLPWQIERDTLDQNGDSLKNRRWLMKLYGDYQQPHKMLLSGIDYELYYPMGKMQDRSAPLTKRLLRKLFSEYHLVFWGWGTEKHDVLFKEAPGIAEMLRETGQKANGREKKRYIFTDRTEVPEEMKECGLLPIPCSELKREELKRYLAEQAGKKTCRKREESAAKAEICVENPASRSSELYDILESYGDGFPLCFLRLLAKDEENLKAWKKAGLQLSDHGLYLLKCGKESVQKRIEYADCLMERADKGYSMSGFWEVIDQEELQLGNSYFYSIGVLKEKETDQKRLAADLSGMMKRLLVILRDRRSGYDQICSVLCTEMSALLKIISGLDDPDFQWKPELLYYLFHAGHEMKPGQTDLDALTEEMIKEIKERKKRAADVKEQDLLVSRMAMLYQIRGKVKSLSDQPEDQVSALEECAKAEWCIGEQDGKLSEELFWQKIRVYLLKSRIFGRLSTIREIERCRREECKEKQKAQEAKKEQNKALIRMYQNLQEAYQMLEQRNRAGQRYEELYAEVYQLQGEHDFKRSQYCWENRRYDGGSEKTLKETESFFYSQAQQYYEKALNLYNDFFEQYGLQKADVLRKMADGYCQMYKSHEKPEAREKCCQKLYQAYELYRKYGSLHGIADVLQSMGNAEEYEKGGQQQIRNLRDFYHTAGSLYQYLNDDWSCYVTENFYPGALEYIEAVIEKGEWDKEIKKELNEEVDVLRWILKGELVFAGESSERNS